MAYLARNEGKVRRQMTRAQLEHLIRAAADIADDNDIVVIGSQAILGQFPNAPESMRVSMERDLAAGRELELANVADPVIREGRAYGFEMTSMEWLLQRARARAETD